MYAAIALGLDGLGEGLGRHNIGARDQAEFAAAHVELWRVAFVFFYMRHWGAEDGVKRFGDAGERQGIGGGAGADQIDLCFGRLKQIPNAGGDLFHAVFGAVAEGVALVGARKRFDHRRMRRAAVVRGEMHGPTFPEVLR